MFVLDFTFLRSCSLESAVLASSVLSCNLLPAYSLHTDAKMQHLFAIAVKKPDLKALWDLHRHKMHRTIYSLFDYYLSPGIWLFSKWSSGQCHWNAFWQERERENTEKRNNEHWHGMVGKRVQKIQNHMNSHGHEAINLPNQQSFRWSRRRLFFSSRFHFYCFLMMLTHISDVNAISLIQLVLVFEFPIYVHAKHVFVVLLSSVYFGPTESHIS